MECGSHCGSPVKEIFRERKHVNYARKVFEVRLARFRSLGSKPTVVLIANSQFLLGENYRGVLDMCCSSRGENP